MIALDDQALARLVISATRIPPRHRAKWLRAFAREVDPITLNARRCGRFREREGAGVALYRLKLDSVSIEAMLEREGLLAPGRDHCHADVSAALAQFITSLSEMHFAAEDGDGL